MRAQMHRPVTGFLGGAARRGLAAILAAGGVAVLPTDTIYGFHCAASSAEAVERIRRLKGRARGSGFILLASGADMAGSVVARWPGNAREALARIWPAPLTAILPARRGLSASIAPRGKVAVRVPARAELARLIDALGEPIVSTSVNLAGERPLARIADIERAFPGLDAYLSQRGRPAAVPSTIVDFTKKTPALVRAGRVPWPPRGGRPGRQSGNPSKRRSL